jgi:hypothetical protein
LDKGADPTKNNKLNHLANKIVANRLDYHNTQKILNVAGNGGMHSHFSCVTLSFTPFLLYCIPLIRQRFAFILYFRLLYIIDPLIQHN